MEIKVRKLNGTDERLEAERLIATSFLHEWNEESARESANDKRGESWGAFNSWGEMVSAVTALKRHISYEGSAVQCGELHMVGTLPEARGLGAVSLLMGDILREYKSRGYPFAILIPFSFSFYRKYGFEAASEQLLQKTDIAQFAAFKQEMTAKRISSQEDADEARRLYENLAMKYNLAELKGDDEWLYRKNGELGERDWKYMDKTHYSYILHDTSGCARAFLSFVFVHGIENPFIGCMELTELVFDSPEALFSVFGFFYSMRAKISHVSAGLPSDMDWSIMLPECDKVERSIDSHVTARALNIEKILSMMRHPEGEGQYSVHIEDSFLPENTATYSVRFSNGAVSEIKKSDTAADLYITVESFCQLAIGLTDLKRSMYRTGTRLCANRSVLERVFVKRPVLLK